MAKRKSKDSAESAATAIATEKAPSPATAQGETVAARADESLTVNAATASAEPAKPEAPEAVAAAPDTRLTPSDTVKALAAGAADLVDPPPAAVEPASVEAAETAVGEAAAVALDENAAATPVIAAATPAPMAVETSQARSEAARSDAAKADEATSDADKADGTLPEVARSRGRLAAAAARLAAQPRAAARHTAAADATATASTSRRFPIAASVAVAAAIGAIVGAFGGDILRGASAESTLVNRNGEMRILRDGVARLQADLAQLQAAFNTDLRTFRASLDEELTGIREGIDGSLSELAASAKATGDQINALGRRLDAADQRNAEPAASRTAEAPVDRETVTAAIPEGRQTRGFQAEPSPQQAEARDAGIVQGWQVVDVFRGRALVDGRRHGLFEVGPGAPLPGVGRVQSIERREGRWVVVTSAGVIMSAPDARPRQF